MSWEQIGNDVVFTAFFTTTKVGKTGLADILVDVYRNGSIIVTDGATFVEEGGGLYRYTLAAASVTVPGRYVAIFKTDDATVDFKHVMSLMLVGLAGVENLVTGAIADQVWDETLAGHVATGTTGEKLDALALLDAVVFGPALTTESLLTLVRGDDYRAEDQRAIEITSSDWPDLTGAEVKMTMRRRKEAFGSGSDPIWFTVSDTYSLRVTGVVGAQAVYFELTKTDTAALVPGTSTGKWDVQAILATTSPSTSPSPSPSVGESAGNVVTLAQGTVTVIEDQTRV